MATPHRMIIFDDGLGQLGPMADLRASFEVRTGMYTTAGRIRALRPRTLAGYWVPGHLRAVVADRADAPVNDLPDEEILHCINGRWAMPDPDLVLETGHAIVEESSGHVVAACLRRADAEYFLQTGELHERSHVTKMRQRLLYKYPWDIVAFTDKTIVHDIMTVRLLDARVAPGSATVIGSYPLEVHASAQIAPNVVFDVEAGPIVVHENAVIRPGAIICGPSSIGAGATVVDRAHVKQNTVIGPMCKVGGEVGATIFQGYANKSHEGHLGDSWVGKWVNLGAGTTNSNLLNTYGEVTMRVEADGSRHRTGLNFLGAIIGDHVKTAIGTRIMTGSVLGTGAMIASTLPPPTTVRRFAWHTDDGVRSFRIEKFIEVMHTMMKRRGKTPETSYIAAVEQLHAMETAPEATPGG
jgi:UDP-N-acetylglucosamine diphosphorylase/glucosamine-1-phosphate N-acetyltransferase